MESELGQYLKLFVDDVEIYCRTDLEGMTGSGELTVEVERTFFSKKLVLYGITMESH